MPRATPLPPDERRAAIVAATLPLLVQHGRDVSTRQIAEAAGVAEGTIFRVFDTKEALIDATLEDVFDPTPTCEVLHAIDPGLDLETRLTAAVTALQRQLSAVFGLFHALRLSPRPAPEHVERQRRVEARINEAVIAVLAPDGDRLGTTVEQAAQLVRTLTFSVTHPMLSQLPHDQPELVVDLLLHGLRVDHRTGEHPLDRHPAQHLEHQHDQHHDDDRRTPCSSVS